MRAWLRTRARRQAAPPRARAPPGTARAMACRPRLYVYDLPSGYRIGEKGPANGFGVVPSKGIDARVAAV